MISENPHKTLAESSAASKKSTEFQSNLTPRETKTDDSKCETFAENSRIYELENEVQFLREKNQFLASENSSLRSILKDYEELKTNEAVLLGKIEDSRANEEEYQAKIDELTRQCASFSQLLQKHQQDVQVLRKENNKIRNDAEMNASHQETKIRLLKEALNKRNEDIKEIEEANDELIKLLQKCDEKLLKLDEDYKLEIIKCEKYEEELGLKQPGFQKYDIQTIDNRISFMVNILEEYRKLLEDSQNESQGKLIALKV